ncbi:MAG: hypothetical protein HY293_15515 [Planctomycetes bacterium]|nr:hypothetical protein [Planctomycetota bacterium]
MLKTSVPVLLLAAVLGCSSKEGEPVASPIPALMAAGVPALDAAAPAKVETATFAVG